MKHLELYRRRIDELDDRIVDLLAERIAVVREVGQVKFANDIPSVLPDRIEEVLGRAANRAEQRGLDPDLVRRLYQVLIEHCCKVEDAIRDDLSEDRKQAPER